MLTTTKNSVTLAVPGGTDEGDLSEFFEQVCLLDQSSVKKLFLDCSQLSDVTSRHITAICHSMFECEKKGIDCKLISIPDSMLIVVKHLKLNDLLLLEDQSSDDFSDTTKIVAISQDTTNVIRLKFEADKSIIKDNLEKFKTFLHRLNLPEKTAYELSTIFYEITMNIKTHGYKNHPNKISFKAEMLDNEISLRFRDAGEKFDPTQYAPDYDPEKSIKKGRKRGLGLILINRIIDKMTYTRENGKVNRLILTKKLY